MQDEDKFKLLFGPYYAPKVPRDNRLRCERRGGWVTVAKAFSDGPISWPRRKGTNSIILCGELVQAVQMESALAVAYHWGVCADLVSDWRRALGVPEANTGTRHLMRATLAALSPEVRRRAAGRAENPTTVLKRDAALQKRGLPLVRPATSKSAKDWIARTGRPLDPEQRLWTPQEEALLGTDTDEQIAPKLKRTKTAVGWRRVLLGIPAWQAKYSRPWTAEEDALLGKLPDQELAKRLKRTLEAVKVRRKQKHLPCVNLQRRPFTPAEDSLLGTMPDGQLADKLGRSFHVVSARRRLLGIAYIRAPCNQPNAVPWTCAEDQLLGTVSDRKLALKLKRSERVVAYRRLLLRIPPANTARRPWTAAEDEILRRCSVAETARWLNRSVKGVQRRREQLGIRSRPSKGVAE
jgi:hypothetical protein